MNSKTQYGNYCLTRETGWELWRSDGTAAGTSKITYYAYLQDIEQAGIAPENAFVAVGNSLFFIGR